MTFFPTAQFRSQDRAAYIEKQKQQQELKRQQEEAIAAAKREAEKPPGEKAAERLSWARDELKKIQPGNPYAMDQTWKIIGGIIDVLDYLFKEQEQQKGGE